MFLKAKHQGSEIKSHEEIMNGIMHCLSEEVKLSLKESKSSMYERKAISLKGMNAFHLAAKYCPQVIEMMHEMTKNEIWKLFSD